MGNAPRKTARWALRKAQRQPRTEPKAIGRLFERVLAGLVSLIWADGQDRVGKARRSETSPLGDGWDEPVEE